MAQEPLWYYLEGQDVRGPVATAQLRQMARARQILPTTQICKAGTEDWMEAARLRLEFGPGAATPAAVANSGPQAFGGMSAPAAEPTVGGEHNLFSPSWLLDYHFRKFVTPQIVKVAWILYLVMAALGFLFSTFRLFWNIINTKPIDWIYPIAFYIGGVLGLMISALFFRAWLEFLINFFYMARRDKP